MRKADLNLLPIAFALYDERNVSRAAQALGMSQPAVSMALRKLRTIFNDPLFIRAPTGVTPTPRADALVRATRPLVERLQEDQAIDKIWDGQRNADGDRVWFGLDRGTSLPALNGATPFFLGVIQFQWNEHDRAFDWRTVTADEYAQIAQDGSRNIADVTDTFGDLDSFRRHGGKLLTFVGANDQLIHPRGSSTTIDRRRRVTANMASRISSGCSGSTGCSAGPASRIAPGASGPSRRTCSAPW